MPRGRMWPELAVVTAPALDDSFLGFDVRPFAALRNDPDYVSHLIAAVMAGASGERQTEG